MLGTTETNATPQQDTNAAPPKPRLLDQMRAAVARANCGLTGKAAD